MRESDRRRLQRRYQGTLTPAPELRLAQELGLPLSSIVSLSSEIFADFDPTAFGVGWWADQLPAQSRILISDHLFACARAVPANMIEAALAQLELLHALDEQSERLQRGIGGPTGFVHPPPRGPYDELVPFRIESHTANVVRALGSALDCLAGCIVGVAALPSDLVKADLAVSRQRLLTSAGDNEHVWRMLSAEVEQAITDAGPDGWLEWLIDLRNTMVHRGRRATSLSIEIVRHAATGAGEALATQLLPASPGLTEIEAWRDAGDYFHSRLSEPAQTTLRGCIDSVGQLVDRVSGKLLDLWQVRRADPGSLAQPQSQWTSAPRRTRVSGFGGYAADPDLLSNVNSVAMGAETQTRLQAAALTGDNLASTWHGASDG